LWVKKKEDLTENNKNGFINNEQDRNNARDLKYRSKFLISEFYGMTLLPLIGL
jgi:hypothetical protein